MTRPAAQEATEIRTRPRALHQAIGPSAGQIVSHEMEDLGESQVTRLLTIPVLLHNTILEHQALECQALGCQALGYQALEGPSPQEPILEGHRMEGLQLQGLQLGHTLEGIRLE